MSLRSEQLQLSHTVEDLKRERQDILELAVSATILFLPPNTKLLFDR